MKRQYTVMLLSLLALLIGSVCLATAQTPNTSFTVARVNTAPLIDGVLDDAAWVQASQMGSKTVVDLSHLGHELSRYPRVAYLAYDDAAIYVSFVVYVPNPDELVVHMPAASHNDEVEIFLGPNELGYHHIIITPNGQVNHQVRGIVSNENLDFDYAVQVGDIYWSVEVAIPFESLQHTPEAGDEWQFNLNGRQIAAGDMWVAWNPTYGSFHNADRFGTLVFGE